MTITIEVNLYGLATALGALSVVLILTGVFINRRGRK